jgi:hypothetical protein
MSDRPLEYAMTHRVGAGGRTERYHRPAHVVETAERMRRWAGTPETCQSCSTRQAIHVHRGSALCGSCSATRLDRAGLAVTDPAGRASRADPSDDDTDGVRLRGHAIVFNVPSVDLGFVEFIRPSAVDRNEAEGIDVRALWSHNPDLTIGRLSAGTLRTRKVRKGLATEIDPPRWGAQYLESVRRKDVTGMSFAFQTMEDRWHLEDGEPVREVLDMRYFEVSGVSFPAYEQTTLTVVAGADRAAFWSEQASFERLRLAQMR